MKTLTFFLLISLISITAYAKGNSMDTTSKRTISADGSQYKASNGKIYKKGGSLFLGSGTGTNQTFIYITPMIGNLVMKSGFALSKYAGAEFPIDEIKQEKIGTKRVYIVSKMQSGKFAVFLEAGLASGEVKE